MSNRYLNLPALAVAACLTAFGGQAALAASEIEVFFPVPVDGQLAIPQGPGLGIDPDPAILEKLRVA